MQRKETAQLTGLLPYLKGYVTRHYRSLRITESFMDARGAFVMCAIQSGGVEYTIRLRVPLNAPVAARPLFDSVYHKEKLLWRYSVDYRPGVPWGEQRRVHLYEFAEVHTLIHVTAGTPYDIIDKVTAINGGDLSSLQLTAILRLHVAKLWGMTTTITKPERKVLANLQRESLHDNG